MENPGCGFVVFSNVRVFETKIFYSRPLEREKKIF